MATLKGQNLRVLVFDENKYHVIAKSTNCQITLTGNTEDASTKDDLSMAGKPEIISKAWSISVDSLDVSDAALLLSYVKQLKKFTLQFDEVSTSDNQTALEDSISRRGEAYLNDVTFTWDDRTNSTKNVQFTGVGPLQNYTTEPTLEAVTVDGNYTKGQFVRLFLNAAAGGQHNPTYVIAAAKQLSLHVSLTLEDTTTKDTQGDWLSQEPTGLNFDISSSALVRSGDVITSQVGGHDLSTIESIFDAGRPLGFCIANTSGANQRTKGDVIVSGNVIITQLQINAANRTNAQYQTTLNGYGVYDVTLPQSNDDNDDDPITNDDTIHGLD